MYATRYPTFGSFFSSQMDPFERMDRIMQAFEQDMARSALDFDSRFPFTTFPRPVMTSRSQPVRIPIRTDEDTLSEDMEMKRAVQLSIKEQEKEQQRKREELTEDEQLQLALELSKMEQQSASEDEEEPLIVHRRLRKEQDDAFEEALKKDQEKERIQEEEMEVQTEQEALQLSIQIAREARYKHALEILSPEPDASDLDITQIMIRLPNGTRLERKFCIHDKIEQLRAFVDSKLMELDCIPLEYDLVSDFPKRVYNNPQTTLLHAGLTPRALVSVSQRE